MYQNRLKAIKQKQAEALDRSCSFIENLGAAASELEANLLM